MKRVINNAGTLLSGTMIASILGLVASIVTARAIGPVALGILTLAQTFAALVATVALPAPWTGLVQYGAQLLEAERQSVFKTLLSVTFGVEVAASLLAGSVGLLIAPWAASWLSVESGAASYFAMYASVLFIRIVGTPKGVLRLYDRFDLLRNVQVAAAVLRTVLAVAGWWAGWGLTFFVMVLIAYEGATYLLEIASAAWVLWQKGVFRIRRASLRETRPHIRGYVWFCLDMHVNDILGTARRKLDYLALGVLLTPTAVGFYKIIKQVNHVLAVLGNPIKQVLYPECCRLWVRKAYDSYRRLLVRAGAGLLAVFAVPAVLLLLVREPFVAFLFGAEYAPASKPLAVYFAANALFVAFQVANVALLSMGQSRRMVAVEVVANLTYFGALFTLVPMMGLWGAVLGFVASVVVWIGGTVTLATLHFHKRIPTVAQTP